MDVQTAGVVLRAVDYKESDRILTVLTAQSGLMTVKARGCRKKNSPLTAASEPFAYSQMTLFAYQDYYTLREVSGLQQFWGLREDVVKLSLAAYFADVTQTIAVEGEPNQELLSLFLNCLYALDRQALSFRWAWAWGRLNTARMPGRNILTTPSGRFRWICGI